MLSATYIAFDGMPIGPGQEESDRVTIGADRPVAPRASHVLARAPAAVRVTPPTARGPHETTNGSTAQGIPTAPSDAPLDTPVPIDPPPDPTTGTSPPDSGPGGDGPLGVAVEDVSALTGLPLDEATVGIADQANQILDDLGELPGPPQVGKGLGTL